MKVANRIENNMKSDGRKDEEDEIAKKMSKMFCSYLDLIYLAI